MVQNNFQVWQQLTKELTTTTKVGTKPCTYTYTIHSQLSAGKKFNVPQYIAKWAIIYGVNVKYIGDILELGGVECASLFVCGLSLVCMVSGAADAVTADSPSISFKESSLPWRDRSREICFSSALPSSRVYRKKLNCVSISWYEHL
jgi:hypothetical protein